VSSMPPLRDLSDGCTADFRILEHAVACRRLDYPVPVYRIGDMDFDQVARGLKVQIRHGPGPTGPREPYIELEFGTTTARVYAAGPVLDWPKIEAVDWRPPVQGRHTLTERYAGATIDIPGGTVELGLQRSCGEPIAPARALMRHVVEECALVLNGDDITEATAPSLSDRIDATFGDRWPDRAWFVEIWDAKERLTQVYHRWQWPGDAP
jgi:hypothetical protein